MPTTPDTLRTLPELPDLHGLTHFDAPFRVKVNHGRFAGTVGTAVARFNDGVLVVVRDDATDFTREASWALPHTDDVHLHHDQLTRDEASHYLAFLTELVVVAWRRSSRLTLLNRAKPRGSQDRALIRLALDMEELDEEIEALQALWPDARPSLDHPLDDGGAA
jgi:hypothetical protein